MSDGTNILEGATAPVFKQTELVILRAAAQILWEARNKVPLDYSGGQAARSYSHAHNAITDALSATSVWLEQDTAVEAPIVPQSLRVEPDAA